MDKQTRNDKVLAQSLIREAKNTTDVRTLYFIAEQLDGLSETCWAAQIRKRAKQLSDKQMVKA